MLAGCMFSMPKRSFDGPLPDLTFAQQTLSDRLEGHVWELAVEIGDRSWYRYGNLVAARDYLTDQLAYAGYEPLWQSFDVRDREVSNIEAILPGRTEEIVVIGAHYDSAPGVPGADDNATGTAAVIELARIFREESLDRTLHFVLFVNEEPPWFKTEDMGSWQYAREAREQNLPISAMLSIESIGYYDDARGSQSYPPPFSLFYPNRGDFIGFVGDGRSSRLTRRAIGTFRTEAAFPSQGVAAPRFVPGVAWSDHWAFWRQGYRAVMITDTPTFRNPHYHQRTDRPEHLDFDRTARVVDGLVHVIRDLATLEAQ